MASKRSRKSSSPPDSAPGQILIYQDAGLNLQVRLDGQTVWLTQLQMADLFQTSKQNISLHIQNVLADGELAGEATVKQYLTVQIEGGRQVRRQVDHYNLEMILAVGYRVRSLRGTQFRQWATARLAFSSNVVLNVHPLPSKSTLMAAKACPPRYSASAATPPHRCLRPAILLS